MKKILFVILGIAIITSNNCNKSSGNDSTKNLTALYLLSKNSVTYTFYSATIAANSGTIQTLVTLQNKVFVSYNTQSSTGNNIYTSTDGKTWTNTSYDGVTAIYDINYINGTYYAVGGSKIYSSSDGNTWTLRNTISNTSLYSIAGNSSYLVVAGSGNSGFLGSISTDQFSTYTNLTNSTNLYISGSSIISGIKAVVLSSGAGYIFSTGGGATICLTSCSTSGNWSAYTIDSSVSVSTASQYKGVAMVNNGTMVYVMGNGNTYYSTGSTTFTKSSQTMPAGYISTTSSGSYFTSYAILNGKFAFYLAQNGSTYNVYTSSDGNTWSFNTQNVTNQGSGYTVNALAYLNGIYISADTGGKLSYSSTYTIP